MFTGFPSLPLAGPAPAVDAEFEMGDENGCVRGVILKPVQQLRLSYPALCHLLQISKQATKSRGMFGRVYGVQMGTTVEVTDVRGNLPKKMIDRDTETREEVEKLREAERVAEKKAFDEMDAIFAEEELDSYQVGQFVVGSAVFNSYSHITMAQLTELHDASKPTVLISYDPFRTGILGRPFLRAFVPSEAYLQYHRLSNTKDRSAKLPKFIQESGVTEHGVLREVPVSLDIDAFHCLGLASVQVAPIPSNYATMNSETVSDYISALVTSVSSNAQHLQNDLEREAKQSSREGNTSGNLGQKIDTLLMLQHLREQTAHLEALCDSQLLSTSLIRDL